MNFWTKIEDFEQCDVKGDFLEQFSNNVMFDAAAIKILVRPFVQFYRKCSFLAEEAAKTVVTL